MARRPRPPEEEVEGFVMTPMIDIVFQLIIFFMLVLDMSKQRLENVTLPKASEAVKEKLADDTLIIVNIMKDGIIRIDGRTFYHPKRHGDDNRRLEDLFVKRRYNPKFQEIPGQDTWVNYPVLIRADRSTEFQHIQKVLMIVSQLGGVTRIQLGAMKGDV